MSKNTIPSGISLVPLWDPIIRLFHWGLVLAVVSGFLLGRFEGVLSFHFYLGYLVGGLLVVRLVWGLVGPKHVRFWSFIYSPKTTIAYLRTMFVRRPSYWPGHNPIGAMSVFALLGVLGFQVLTGLIADPDDFINVGPFASMVEFDTARWASTMHRLSSKLLLVFVGLHLAAILFYRFWKHENLVTPMITGMKQVKTDDKLD